MNFKNIILYTIFIFIITAATGFSQDINWQSYEKGRELASENNKKLYIYFYSDRCPWCTKMENETFQKDSVSSYLNENFVPVKVNVQNEPQITQQYGIGPIPASVFMQPDLETGIYKRPGYVDEKDFLKILETIHLEKNKE
ncbi:MAG: thioredoxin family protein [Thermodesulfobacteriota bacterium]